MKELDGKVISDSCERLMLVKFVWQIRIEDIKRESFDGSMGYTMIREDDSSSSVTLQ